MTPETFAEHAAAGYNRIPVSREVLADLETPLSTYLKLARGPYSYLLESVHGGEQWGRYSIIGLPCLRLIKVNGYQVRVEQDGEVEQELEVDDPLQWIDDFRSGFRVPDVEGLPRFDGGLVGYFGYDTVRYIEPRLGPNTRPDPIGTPDILLMVSEQVVVFDNLRSRLYLVVHQDPAEPDAWEQAKARLDQLEQALNQDLDSRHRCLSGGPRGQPAVNESDFQSGFSRAGFEAAVEHIKRYIVDGDVMQTVPSQRLSIPFASDPLDLYRALRCLNPSPYLYFLDLDEFHIVGSSPEILARLEGDVVTVRPIAGTRPRGATPEEDKALEQDLLADPKELAEHLMLIDLGRNDIGRVAKTGSVLITDKMIVERYSHVMHIVSNVIGHLRPGLGAIDVLRATFPAGTLSGAPKVRAMEIIDEVEPVKRGIYGGAVGYISFSGNMDTAIAIRTAVIKDGTLNIQAGAGIVHDSVPATEWEETMNKGRAIFRAVSMVANGLKTCR